jgi:hypothetical protein
MKSNQRYGFEDSPVVCTSHTVINVAGSSEEQ